MKNPVLWSIKVANQLKLKTLPRLVLFILAKHSDGYGRAYNLTLKSLLQESGLSCLTVMRVIRKLAKMKVICTDFRNNFYYLRVNVAPQTLNEIGGGL